MKTIKQSLSRKHQEYQSEEDILYAFYSEHIKRFCLEFNAKLFSYKTYSGFLNKKNKLIKNYDLKIVE